jgi:hypothetical protein
MGTSCNRRNRATSHWPQQLCSTIRCTPHMPSSPGGWLCVASTLRRTRQLRDASSGRTYPYCTPPFHWIQSDSRTQEGILGTAPLKRCRKRRSMYQRGKALGHRLLLDRKHLLNAARQCLTSTHQWVEFPSCWRTLRAPLARSLPFLVLEGPCAATAANCAA